MLFTCCDNCGPSNAAGMNCCCQHRFLLQSFKMRTYTKSKWCWKQVGVTLHKLKSYRLSGVRPCPEQETFQKTLLPLCSNLRLNLLIRLTTLTKKFLQTLPNVLTFGEQVLEGIAPSMNSRSAGQLLDLVRDLRFLFHRCVNLGAESPVSRRKSHEAGPKCFNFRLHHGDLQLRHDRSSTHRVDELQQRGFHWNVFQ